MASTRDIRRRIKSVKNTRQITKAMELVAASKMKKAQSAALSSRPYAHLMAEMLSALGTRIEDVVHPFLVKREVKTRGILLVTTDKGLCGPLNSNVFKVVLEVKTPVKYVAVGRKAAQFLARTKRALLADFPVHDRVPMSEVIVAADYLIKLFIDGEVDTVEVIYPHYKNTLVQEPTCIQLLPLGDLSEMIKELRTGHDASAPKADDRPMLFEPNVSQGWSALLRLYVHRQIHSFILDAKA